MSFSIVTACSRPLNLPAILDSIVPGAPKDALWVVMHDLSHGQPESGTGVQSDSIKVLHSGYRSGRVGWGHRARNEWLNLNVLGWTYFLDDDNLLHPDFWACVKECESRKMFVFSQEHSEGAARAPNVQPCHIDLAQFVFRREAVPQGLRFGLHYEGDGEFISALWESLSPDDRVSLDRVGCYYNRLRW